MGSQTVAITIDVPAPNLKQNSPRPAETFPPAAAYSSSSSTSSLNLNSPASNSSAGRSSGRKEDVDLKQHSGPVSGIREGEELQLRVRVWRALRDYEWEQVGHTGRVFALALALCMPMLAVQTALKNMGDYYERAPLPGIDPLNRTLPDVLLNLWQPHPVRPPRAVLCCCSFCHSYSHVWHSRSLEATLDCMLCSLSCSCMYSSVYYHGFCSIQSLRVTTFHSSRLTAVEEAPGVA